MFYHRVSHRFGQCRDVELRDQRLFKFLSLSRRKVRSHLVGHVLEHCLRWRSLKVTFGFAAARFRSIRRGNDGRGLQANRDEQRGFQYLFFHKGTTSLRVIRVFDKRRHLFLNAAAESIVDITREIHPVPPCSTHAFLSSQARAFPPKAESRHFAAKAATGGISIPRSWLRRKLSRTIQDQFGSG